MRGVAMIGSALVASAAAAGDAWRLVPLDAARTTALEHPALRAAARVLPDFERLDEHATRLMLVLPDGSRVEVEGGVSERRAADDYTWIGTVPGDAEQQVVLTRRGLHLAGYLSLKLGIHELTPSTLGPLLLALDSERFPSCGGALTPPTSGFWPSPPSHSIATRNPDLMDVLVVFSPGALAQLGGQPQAQVFAQNAVDSANQAFANSQMSARLRLAGVRFTSRADSGNSSTDLGWLRADAEVAAWRNEVGADMVGMIAEFSNACGQGYLMGNPPGPAFAPNAYQVTARTCAIGNLSYAHEHGHNMGFQHNPENGSGAAFPYAYGHWVNGNFRTVMSYSNPCTSGCTRRPYFSNPNVNFNGAPTGIADQRDNARAGALTAPIVAAFRAPVLGDALFRDGFEAP